MTPELIKSVVNKTDSKPIEKNQLFCYLAYWFTDWELKEIGKYVNRTHSTVLYSVQVIINRKKTDYEYFKKVENLKTSLKSAT